MIFPVRNGVNINSKSAKCLCDLYLIDFQASNHLFEHDLIEKFLKVEESIGIGVSKGDYIVFVWWFVLKMKAIVVKIFVILTIYVWFAVTDVLTASWPPYFIDSSIVLREEYHAHALLVQRCRFCLNKWKFTRFAMLNLYVFSYEISTVKLNHCVFPLEFMSFCKIKSYSASATFINEKLLAQLQGGWQISSLS